MSQCTFDGCDRTGRLRRGLCSRHYYRLRTYGDPSEFRHYSSIEEAIAGRVRVDGECRIWTGHIDDGGYGRVSDRPRGSNRPAHVVSWELTNGPIPEGMVIDHRCWNRACINPDHLRLATRTENARNVGKMRPDNTSGYRGVYWNKRNKCWVAVVQSHGKAHTKWGFATPEDAAECARQMREHYFGAFAGKG